MFKFQALVFLAITGWSLIHIVMATATENGYCKNPWDDCTCSQRYPRDCEDIQKHVSKCNGIYTIYVGNHQTPVEVYCDMKSSNRAWTILQRREDGYENFNRKWADYAKGFGNRNGEYWIGNTALYLLTSQANYLLRIDLEDFTGEKRYAEYTVFKVASLVDKYRLHIGGYSGTAGDAMAYHNGMKFSTYDNDNDVLSSNCASVYKGAWWHNACHYSNLNGLYLAGDHTGRQHGQSINWYQWKGHYYSLKFTEMKVKLIKATSE